MFKSAIKYLVQPYPIGENRWILIFSISIFVALFMTLFKPFGSASIKSNNLELLLSGYGLVTFVVLLFNLKGVVYLFKNTFNEENWRVWKEILWYIYLISMIGVLNCLYSTFIGISDFSFSAFIRFQIFTVLIGVIPAVVLIILNQNRLLLKNLEQSQILNNRVDELRHSVRNETNRVVDFCSDNEKELLKINLDQLLYIESQGNYIRLFLLVNEAVTVNTLRSTLKSVEDLLAEYPEFIRCHRGYLVNLLNVKSVDGNSQGYRLHFNGSNSEVPVSRAFTKIFQESLGRIERTHLHVR